ncbi:DNA translocase FtsK [Lonepinella sp. BR2357]|uniref:DNA translocase FtsK n=1 Tax=Lonepinella sp. BR2357 TaxID=3434549 RepID=UPI003F6E1C94
MIRKITDGFSPTHYLVEVLFGLTALFGFYLIIAWSSYSPFDNAWSVVSYQDEVINKAGRLGAWVIDLFFVLFGYVGHLLPFLLCIAPIYFIRTKRVDSLTWTRFSLRMFGFVLLMLGLTALSAMLLPHTSDHLAGGVLGGVLAKYMLPLLGKFGLLLFGVLFSILGFIFCSGASLIRLVVRFYNWLTVKNEEPVEEITAENEEELNDISVQASAPQEEDNTEIETVQPIHISGLGESVTDPQHTQTAYEDVTAGFVGDDVFKPIEFENPTLPEVKIAQPNGVETTEINVVLPSQVTKDDNINRPDFLTENGLNVTLPQETPTPVIPEVKLTPAKPLMPIENEGLDDLSAELAEQFAQQEAEKERQRLEQAQQLSVHLANQPDDISIEVEETEEAEEEKMQNGLRTIPIDKLVELYGDHTPKEKPTTDLPLLDLLDKRVIQAQDISEQQIFDTSKRIEQQLQNFKIKATVKDVLVGPVVTRYELELLPGVKASAVSRIDTDLARALMFKAIRVTESIPGKPYIGIETPNEKRQIVPLRDVLDSDEFRNSKALLPMALGKDISGTPIVIDLAKTPHLLVAGSTGSGKSVGINTMILSLLFRVKPEEVKFIMIDPKVVELSIYNDIPHLLTEVVTDMKKAANALRWCVDEMERRYQLLSQLRVRNIEGFNERLDSYREQGIGIPDPLWKPGDTLDSTAPLLERMNYIVVIVDEFADLMMQVGKQIEELIARLTQKARAVGIHVILATQRPSVDVITGLIKSNIPSRIAFTVVQRNDSRTILDQNGAEALLGMGDMLYLGNGTTDLVRVHGAYMSDDEVSRVADDWRARGKPNYISSILESAEDNEGGEDDGFATSSEELDPLFDKAVEIVVNTGMTSTSFIQRRLKIGFNRAANLMDQLEEQGIVSEMRNGKRELLARTPDY